ncbi:glucans biosynthesis glucosyltransferase MdoH [Muricoccus nepalensis]|uniref:glucans biosynthesis glucosyltransferase MdoH n=1 Tax=Muricoccus nepalensis TaxID=1854500 RepID=UPI001386E4A7|nr:glucans biosynthesis glucosyltransferase MdoH [Roseomonas nepalensis]
MIDQDARIGATTAKDAQAAGSSRFERRTVAAPRAAERLGGRRAAIAALAGAIALALVALGGHVMAGGGWTLWEALMMGSLAVNAPWLGLTAATALAGLAIRLLVRDPSAFVVPALGRADPVVHDRTLLALCVRLEDMETVLPPMGRLLGELRARHGDRFVLGVLSDTPPGAAAEAEAEAIAALAARFPPGAVRYRRRAENTGFKAGNLMDFLDHHAAGFDHALVLDADSAMSAKTVGRLVRTMQADPGLAILQASIDGRGVGTRFARLFGFGLRYGTRSWVTGQGWWQGPSQLYWGHNALIRIAAFRRDARLPTLPGGVRILSHDYAEAARLHAGGWAVRVLPDSAGSWERHPPDLPALFVRDLRWAAGNLQYRHLLLRPDFGRLGRFQMLEAILHYALAPFRFAFLPLAALNAASGGGEGTPRGALLLLLLLAFAVSNMPKLAGYAEALLRPGRFRRAALLRGMAQELALGLMLDTLEALERSLTLLQLARGRFGGWTAQRRNAREVTWAAAARRFGGHTAAGLALLAGFGLASGFAALAALPALAGLVFAIPLAVLTARPRRGARAPAP